MQEAFQSALDKIKNKEGEPEDLEVTADVAASMSRLARAELYRAQKTKRDLDLTTLYRGYWIVGRHWEVLRLLMPVGMNGRDRSSESDVKHSWSVLQRNGRDLNLSAAEATEALGYLTNGMSLDEELVGPSSLHRLYYIEVVRSEEAMRFASRALFDDLRFTPASQTLMFAVTDMANMDKAQMSAFYGFMYDPEGSRRMDLIQTRGTIAKYLTKV